MYLDLIMKIIKCIPNPEIQECINSIIETFIELEKSENARIDLENNLSDVEMEINFIIRNAS